MTTMSEAHGRNKHQHLILLFPQPKGLYIGTIIRQGRIKQRCKQRYLPAAIAFTKTVFINRAHMCLRIQIRAWVTFINDYLSVPACKPHIAAFPAAFAHRVPVLTPFPPLFQNTDWHGILLPT